MTQPSDIAEGDTPAEFCEKVNNTLGELFDPDWCVAGMSGSISIDDVGTGGATFPIPSGIWTEIPIDIWINDENTTSMWLDNTYYMYFYEVSGFGADESSGFWNRVITIAWDNTAVGLPRHVRKLQTTGHDDLSPYPYGRLIGSTTEQIFDPAAGITGANVVSFMQCHIQPGQEPDTGSNHYAFFRVWQNSGMTINIKKVGIQATAVYNCRLGEDERGFAWYDAAYPTGFPPNP